MITGISRLNKGHVFRNDFQVFRKAAHMLLRWILLIYRITEGKASAIDICNGRSRLNTGLWAMIIWDSTWLSSTRSETDEGTRLVVIRLSRSMQEAWKGHGKRRLAMTSANTSAKIVTLLPFWIGLGRFGGRLRPWTLFWSVLCWNGEGWQAPASSVNLTILSKRSKPMTMWRTCHSNASASLQSLDRKLELHNCSRM